MYPRTRARTGWHADPVLTEEEPPRLPPFWREWASRMAEGWQVPVFVLGAVSLLIYVLFKPEREHMRPWEEYVRDAGRAFVMAVRAQDERGDAKLALKFLAGENVEELAAARTRALPASLPAEVRNVRSVHGVLPSYDRAVLQAGEEVLDVDDLVRIGESYYRLGIIKSRQPERVGRSLNMSARDLYSGAERYLSRALQRAGARGLGRGRDRSAAEWRRRRRMRAECLVFLGEYRKAIVDLADLLTVMNAAAAERLRAERDPQAGTRGQARLAGPGEAAEWAKVHELLGRCYDRLGRRAEAVDHYRFFLKQGLGGALSRRIRLRLAELLMEAVIEQQTGREAQTRLSEVEDLCRRLRRSDAAPGLREAAVFLSGRAAYRRAVLIGGPSAARGAWRKAVQAFSYDYSPGGRQLDMARVLLARSLHFSGRKAEALEIVDGVLRVGAGPAIYACAEVTRADMLAESNPAEAVGGRVGVTHMQFDVKPRKAPSVAESLGLRLGDLDAGRAAALGLEQGGAEVVEVLGTGPAGAAGLRPGDVIVRVGRAEVSDAGEALRAGSGTSPEATLAIAVVRPDEGGRPAHGYIDIIGRIRRLSDAERARLVPELAELLEDDHFVSRSPEPGRDLPAGGAQLVRIARAYSDLRRYDEAARIYSHILRAYPGVAADRYSFLLGELYVSKAEYQERLGRSPRERRWARLAAARAFMRVPVKRENSRFAADAYWAAGKNYFAAGRYDGAGRALAEFTRRYGDDARLSEGLYLLGESLRRMGDLRRAAEVFQRCSVNHRNEHFGYLSNLALGETYLEMGLLDRVEGNDEDESGANARAVFEAIRRDARYTPESLVWMKALYRLGETYYRLGRRDLMRVREMEAALRDTAVVSRAAGRVEALRRAGVDAALVAGQKQWAGKLKKAAAEEDGLGALITRTRADAKQHLRAAAEVLGEAHERYPPDTFGPDRPGFREFLESQVLASRRTLAMVRFNLATTPADLEGAHRLFAEILKLSGGADAAIRSERAEREAYRSEAYTFKGLIEMRTGRHAQAASTFQDAFEEFSRSMDGPWFAFAAGMALEAGGRRGDARRKYGEALNAYDRLKGSMERTGRGEVTGRPWLLSLVEWMDHAAWVEKSARLAKGEGSDG